MNSLLTAAPLCASGIAAATGLTHKTVIKLYKAGAIPAEIAEGRLYRFDLAKVKAALAERANPKPAQSK